MVDNIEMTKNGWSEWSKHVLLTLQALDKNQKDMNTKIDEMVKVQTTISNEIKHKVGDVDFKEVQTELKFKSGMWGAIAGLIPTIGLLILLSITGGL